MTDKILDAIKKRRSIRKYKQEPISDELIKIILESVKWAPSWANAQCWEIIVIKDNTIKEELKNTLSKTNPAQNAVEKAPVVFGLCAKKNIAGFYKNEPKTKFNDWFMFDLGIAAQNICLTAHSLNLGTVIIGMFDHDNAKTILDIPNDVEIAALICLGYPDKEPKAPKRKEINEFTHQNKY